MSDCPNSGSHGCNFTCQAGGSWSVCPPPSRFIGCCAQDPCENGCPPSLLYRASFNNALFNIISPNVCPDNNSSWYTCNFTTPTFLGCCLNSSNPCQLGDCPSGSLRPAAWIAHPQGKFSNQYSIFLDGGSAAPSAVPTTSANSASATSTSTVSVTTAPQPSSSGLSKGAIAGIAVGVVVALLVIVGLIAIVMYQRGMIAGTRPRAPAPNESPELVTKPMEKLDPKHKSSAFIPTLPEEAHANVPRGSTVICNHSEFSTLDSPAVPIVAGPSIPQ